MQRWLVLSLVVAIGCSDDGRNKTTPDTALVEVPDAISNQRHVRILFEARGNANGFVCTLDGQSSMCISPFEADVADGPHTFEVAASLNANIDETPAMHAWRIDSVTPETTLTSAPPTLDNSVAPVFTFTGSDPTTLRAAPGDITFECAIDEGTFTPCTSPHTVNSIDGLHSFQVRSKDEAGNVDPTPAIHGWTIDATAPDTMITNGPAAGATTGPSGSFMFSSPDATATFECQVDAAAFAACTSPFAFTLANGAHTFSVRAKDTVGIVDPSPAMRAWTVDAVAPPVTITATPADPTNVTTPMFSFSSTDTTATFECQIDGVVTFTACTSPWTGPTVTDGGRTFRVRATDPFANVGTPATFGWTVDTVAPTVTLSNPPAALSNDSTPSVSFTTAGGPVTTECRADAGAFAACTSPFTSAALADGAHTLSVRATDLAGNPAVATTASFTIDTVPPSVTFTGLPSALSNDTTPTVTFTTAGGATIIQCAVDAGAFGTCTSPFTPTVAEGTHTISVRVFDAATNSATFTTGSFVVDTTPPAVTITGQPAALSNNKNPSVTFTHTGTSPTCQLDAVTAVACTSPHMFTNVADGAHTITVRVVDGAGNPGSATTSSFTIDTVAPTVTFTGLPSALSNDNTPTLTFTTAGGATTIECAVDAGTFATCASPFTATVADGSHTISVRVTDAATNSATFTTGAFVVDTTPPSVTITSQPAALSNNKNPAVAFTHTGTSPTCQLDSAAAVACTSPHMFTNVADGAHTITVGVVDGAGNPGSATTASFTIDTAAPSVTFTGLPAALSNDTTPTLTFTTAGGATTIECAVDAGTFSTCASPFTATVGEGTHTISVRVTDAATNSATFTTGSFVVDTTAPTVTFTGLPAALSNDTTPTLTFTTAGGATIIQCAVDAGSFSTCASPFTTTVAEGTHTISVRVTDAATNSATFTTGSFVIDTTPPTVTITGQPAALSNNKNPAVVFTHDGLSPTCQLDANAPVACTSPHTFSNVADGAHTITVTVVDGAGNPGSATTASFTIDTVGPVLSFVEQPPAQWPVNYFDFNFSVGDSATVQCSLDGAAFTTCSGTQTVTVAYNVAHTFAVRGTDAAGNPTTITSNAWTPVPGQVLHYPWEQGSAQNTSLLRQRPSHSPDGPAAGVSTFVGGWAGSALGNNVAAHTYPKTARPLTSSPTGTYSLSFWIRTIDGANGTIFSTVGATGGLRATIAGGSQLTLTAFEGGQSQQVTVALSVDQWVHIGARTTGIAKGLEVFVDGAPRAQMATISGFNSGQASALTVGNWSLADVDDLRFYNVAFSNDDICFILARGFKNANGACVPLSPGFEIDFENRIVDTGMWNLPLAAPQGGSFQLTSHTLGQLFHLVTTFDWGYAIGGASFSANVAAVPNRSFTFEFVPGAAFGRIIDWRTACDPLTGGGGFCGIQVAYPDNGQIQIYTGTPTEQKTTSITNGLVPNRFNNVVVTEQRSAGNTTSLTVFVNGKATVIPITGGDLYARVRDDIRLVVNPNLFVDEYEFWAADLSKTPELLCENGIDGEFDVASGSCQLTYGP